MRIPSNFRHLLLLAAAIAGLTFAVSPVQAARPTVAQQIQHFIECLDWMINNPARHAEECAPGHVYIIPEFDPPERCRDYQMIGYLKVGDDGCCFVRLGFVQADSEDCYNPCVSGSSLAIRPAPDMWMLVQEQYSEDCIPASSPLNADELLLFAI